MPTPTTTPKSLTSLALAALAALSLACGDAAAPTRTPVGAYLLRSVNGKPLPQLVSRTADRDVELLDGTLTFRAEGTFTFAGHVRATQGGQSAVAEQVTDGAWELRGATMTVVPRQAGIIGDGALVRWDGATTVTLDDRAAALPVTLVFTR